MKLTSISGVVFQVQDLDKSAEFYQIMGFRVGKREDNTLTFYVNWFWVRLVQADAVENSASSQLCMKADSVEAYHDLATEHGYTIINPPSTGTSGPEFTLVDPDGHHLTFFEGK